MNLAADISLYPLTDNYIPPIDEIIARFTSYSHIQVRRNALSTQLFGEYGEVMRILQIEMRNAFEQHKAVLVVKFASIPAPA